MGSQTTNAALEKRFETAHTTFLETYNSLPPKGGGDRSGIARNYVVKVLKVGNCNRNVGAIPGLQVNARFASRKHMNVVGGHPEILQGTGNKDLGGLVERSVQLPGQRDCLIYISAFNCTVADLEAGLDNVMRWSVAMHNSYKLKLPVRVFRRVWTEDGKKHEFLYAGLYEATSCWTGKGAASAIINARGQETEDDQLRVYYKLERLPGQAPLADCQMYYKGDRNKKRQLQLQLTQDWHRGADTSEADMCCNCYMNIDATRATVCSGRLGGTPCAQLTCKPCLDVAALATLEATADSQWLCPTCAPGAKPAEARAAGTRGVVIAGTVPVTPLPAEQQPQQQSGTAAFLPTLRSTMQRTTGSGTRHAPGVSTADVQTPPGSADAGQPQRTAAPIRRQPPRTRAEACQDTRVAAEEPSPSAAVAQPASGSGKRRVGADSGNAPSKKGRVDGAGPSTTPVQQLQPTPAVASPHAQDEREAPSQRVQRPDVQEEEGSEEYEEWEPRLMRLKPESTAVEKRTAADKFAHFVLTSRLFVFNGEEVSAVPGMCRSLTEEQLEVFAMYLQASPPPPNAAEFIRNELEKFMKREVV